jgi:HSP20 family molecular chaperone IbpA
MYTTNLKTLLDVFDMPTVNTSGYEPSMGKYVMNQLEDGKRQLCINVLGHDVNDIKLEATDDKITVKVKKPEDSYPLIEDINLSFSVGKDWDGAKTEAEYINGLLIVTIDKKDERKPKNIQIKFG